MQSVPPAHGPSDASILRFPAPYEERYRWTPTMVTGAALGAASLLAAILAPAVPLLVRVPLAVAGTAGTVSCLAYSTSRKVAFRVDHQGITLGGGPLRYEAHTSFFPWEGVDAVVLWRRATPGSWPALRWPALHWLTLRASVRYVSVQRHTELRPAPPGRSGPAAPGPEEQRPAPEDLKAGATRGMQAFRVDDGRLAAAIAAFAPTVKLIILT
jgi:hypothetical protein